MLHWIVLLPGEILSVSGSVFDLRNTTRLGDVIVHVFNDTKNPGFDHNFVVEGSGMRQVALLQYANRQMKLSSDQPGVQFYTGEQF